jgi:hypothetical protein
LIAARGVGVVAGDHRTYDGDLVGQLSRLRHQLADVQAGRFRGDGAEVATNVGGSVRLGIPRLMLTDSTPVKQNDD